jgi:hypothetical protein
MMLAAIPLFAAGIAVSALSPASAQTVIIAPTAPPPPQVETIPPPPSATMVWQPGHWRYTDSRWDWVGGHYAARPQQTATWEPGHWAVQPNGGYSWIDGRWSTGG